MIVDLILEKKPEEALELLSKRYGVEKPKIKIGRTAGRSKSAGCYIPAKKTIYVFNREALYNPHVILHEFYHHMRTSGRKHRGAERYADEFARLFLESHRRIGLIKSNEARSRAVAV
jgi:hypothetical protein